MPGPHYERMSAAEQQTAILGLAASTWPWDIRETALRGILGFNDIQADSIKAGRAGTIISTANLASYTTTLAAYLNVAMPAVPADIAAMTAQDRLALAQALDLAFWDWNRRRNALDSVLAYYRQVVAGGGAAPTILQFRNTFLETADAIRAQRGLAALTA